MSHNPSMENQHLFQPLIPPTATATATSFLDEENVDHNIDLISSNSGIILGLLSILFIGVLSIWANHEASKGFGITILNDVKDSPAGREFALSYVSNDKAVRIILNASEFVEKLLYPDNKHYLKKQVNHVTLRLTGRNLTHTVMVNSGEKHDFVMHISSSVMKESDVNYSMLLAVHRGMARIWFWDGEWSAPQWLLEGMVEYVSILAGFGGVENPGDAESPESDKSCWPEDKDPVAVAQFLNYCGGHKKGFIQQLNQAMQHRWQERTVDDALGMPVQNLCASYNVDKKLLKQAL